MTDRKSFLFGALLLTLVTGAVGALWLQGASSTSAAPLSTGYAPAEIPPALLATLEGERSPIQVESEEPIAMTVYLTPTCGCCSGWVDHIQEHGFEVELQYRADLNAVKEALGVRPELASCHTAVANGYVLEGHIPGPVIREFLALAPQVRGLAVPGMPIGSPGMESGDLREPYDVLTFLANGRTQVFSRQGRN